MLFKILRKSNRPALKFHPSHFIPLTLKSKVNKSLFDIDTDEPHVCFFADAQMFFAAHDAPVNRRMQNSGERAARGDAGDDCLKRFADAVLHHARGDGFSHFSFDLSRGAFAFVAMRGNRF